jgi:indole-3-glycerol phosphate synthase
LVEVHSHPELECALEAGAPLIGINNRDLHTFEVSLETTAQLRTHIPAEIPVVSESGIHSREDVTRLAEMGVQAILVGESLVTAADIPQQVRYLAGGQTLAADDEL